jgi:hypothetical protein
MISIKDQTFYIIFLTTIWDQYYTNSLQILIMGKNSGQLKIKKWSNTILLFM